MLKPIEGAKMRRWLRFIVGGSINTGFTYVTYLGLNSFLNYQAAYLIAYVAGIIFSYWFNARIVFRVPLSWKGLLTFPAVYIVQYVISAFLLGSLVEHFGKSESIAPILVAMAMIPVSYFMSKSILQRSTPKATAPENKPTHEQH